VVAIDAERLLPDLGALRRIGRDRTGVHRPALGEADLAARAGSPSASAPPTSRRRSTVSATSWAAAPARPRRC
jgi:hypothetical protein